jgi:hypothetical protein
MHCKWSFSERKTKRTRFLKTFLTLEKMNIVAREGSRRQKRHEGKMWRTENLRILHA